MTTTTPATISHLVIIGFLPPPIGGLGAGGGVCWAGGSGIGAGGVCVGVGVCCGSIKLLPFYSAIVARLKTSVPHRWRFWPIAALPTSLFAQRIIYTLGSAAN